MSVFHHKAELMLEALPKLRYRFFPRHIDEEPRSGEFEVSIDTWEVVIIEETGDSQDERSVLALVHKLKKHMAGNSEPPHVIHYVA